MSNRVLKVHPADNIIVALRDLQPSAEIEFEGSQYRMKELIPQKHKFAAIDFASGDDIIMYGVRVGKATRPIQVGERISLENTHHATDAYGATSVQNDWKRPSVEGFSDMTFNGYHREDGKVGTRNYWIVFPLVFCENRNIKVIEEAMVEQLGYGSSANYVVDMNTLVSLYEQGKSPEEIMGADIETDPLKQTRRRVFPNVDGIRFLTHEGGCGGIGMDSEALCRLLAGYIANANVAGATVLSLGCQKAQIDMMEDAIRAISPNNSKPVFFLEQQKSSSERAFIEEAVKKTFVGLMGANKTERRPAPLSKLTLGLECGGSDGFSGITANPALGHVSDMLATLGGASILSEFPELNGVEQEIINRCAEPGLARKFTHLMESYNNRAKAQGSGFDMNPSPGNIKDGLITDAIKSAGAAKKGGTSPVMDVLDYTEQVSKPGLNLLCTPGNDVESTTGLAGSGANMIVFTTGLGTPTGNAISPTIKFSTNTSLSKRMPDIIDIDAGTIIEGIDTIQDKGEELLNLIVKVASGEVLTRAEVLEQNDFIPWKRGISL